MNNDIRPSRPQSSQQPQEQASFNNYQMPDQNTPIEPSAPSLPPVNLEAKSQPPSGKSPKRNKLVWVIGAFIAFVVLVVLMVLGWYSYSQLPVDSSSNEKIEVVVEPGMTPGKIGELLHQKGLIRSQAAFSIYTRIHDIRGSLQAGDYRISPSENLSSVANHLLKGASAQFTITFYPGATLYDPTDIKDERRTDVYTMLTRAGYSDAEVRAALEKDYEHPLLADKPAGSSLEGYIYGETYTFGTDTNVEQILLHTFDEFYKKIEEQDILAKAAKRDMNLYEAIILGSIIEREVSGLAEDQKQVSQIFHKRLEEGISLGADATFMYAAQQRNVSPETTLDSPYNTRMYRGLPPGPIAVPDIVALEAAVNPSSGDYLYFVSGDDGTTHFSRTLAEHEELTAKYCTTLCQIP